MLTKKKLAITLSRLKQFEEPDAGIEQYPTDSEFAAEILWNAHLLGDIEGKTIADLGCGTGILGIGALLLGAGEAYLLDKDEEALAIAKENLEELGLLKKAHLSTGIVSEFDKKADTVVQNPPFGAKKENRHADRAFLEQAFETAGTIYSIHMLDTDSFIRKIAIDHGFRVTHIYRSEMPIKATQKWHKKRIKRVNVGCWRITLP